MIKATGTVDSYQVDGLPTGQSKAEDIGRAKVLPDSCPTKIILDFSDFLL
jgi:hypothetical protein